MIDFEELARRKRKHLFIAETLLVCLFLLVFSNVIHSELIVVSVFVVLSIYTFHCLPYIVLLDMLGTSKKISEKIQCRTEILQSISPSDDYDYEVEPILHYPFFLK